MSDKKSWDEEEAADRKYEADRDALLEGVIDAMIEHHDELRTGGRSLDDGFAADLWRGVGPYGIWVYVCIPPDFYDQNPQVVEVKFEIEGGVRPPAGMPIDQIKKGLQRFWTLNCMDTFYAHRNWETLGIRDVTERDIAKARASLKRNYSRGDLLYFARADKLNQQIERQILTANLAGHDYPHWDQFTVMPEEEDISFDFYGSVSLPNTGEDIDVMGARLRGMVAGQARRFHRFLHRTQRDIRQAADAEWKHKVPTFDDANSPIFVGFTQPK